MARYADSLLTEGEVVVLRSRQHWLALAVRARRGIALFIVGLIVLLVIAIFKPTDNNIKNLISLVGLVLIVIGVLEFLFRWWQWSNQDYVVTNRRLLKVTGIFNKHSADSSLEKINDAILDQPMLGRMLNYGDLSILTAAEEEVDKYHMLRDPKEFKKVMLTQKHDLETGFMYPAAMPPTPPLRADSPMQAAPAMQPFAPAPVAAPPAAPAPAPMPAPDLSTPLPSDPAPAASEGAANVAAGQAAAHDKSLEVTQTLARLADLRDKGAITAEEYDQKKQELLGRL
jgi:flagellar biosynthesis protein FliQ